MSKFSKITFILIFVLLLILNMNFAQATEEVSTLSEDIQTTEADAAADEVTSALDALSTSSVTRVSNVNSYEQANLHLNNILSIILISIGVLLILFAIAILIRLKK